jgi:hypothetical protein
MHTHSFLHMSAQKQLTTCQLIPSQQSTTSTHLYPAVLTTFNTSNLVPTLPAVSSNFTIILPTCKTLHRAFRWLNLHVGFCRFHCLCVRVKEEGRACECGRIAILGHPTRAWGMVWPRKSRVARGDAEEVRVKGWVEGCRMRAMVWCFGSVALLAG